MKIIENRERNIQKKFRVTEKENERIKLMMKKTGINNFSVFARRACCNKEIFLLIFQNTKILFLKFLRQNLNSNVSEIISIKLLNI